MLTRKGQVPMCSTSCTLSPSSPCWPMVYLLDDNCIVYLPIYSEPSLVVK